MSREPLPPGNSNMPANERLRHPKKGVIDQRQQQIDPAGRHRQDANARPGQNTKQPGRDVRGGGEDE